MEDVLGRKKEGGHKRKRGEEVGRREGEKDVEKVFEAAELSLIHRAPESGSHYQKIRGGGGVLLSGLSKEAKYCKCVLVSDCGSREERRQGKELR